MGEFGAISVISGNIIGRTQTLTLYVEGAYKVRDLGFTGRHQPFAYVPAGGCTARRQLALLTAATGICNA